MTSTYLPTYSKIHDFNQKSFISISQLTVDGIQCILQRVVEIRNDRAKFKDFCHDKILLIDFENASTRTRMSTEIAWLNLGGKVAVVNSGSGGTSQSKGENIFDHYQTLVDLEPFAIAMRCSQEFLPEKLVQLHSQITFINCGDGNNEHPTQAMLDLYTICHHLGVDFSSVNKLRDSFQNKKILFVGDIKHGRTIHSLGKLLNFLGVEMLFCAPLSLHSKMEFEQYDIKYQQYDISELKKLSQKVDIIYATRLQFERMSDSDKEQYKNGVYIINSDIINNTKAILMHPLPRNSEIEDTIDNHSQSVYFGKYSQINNGLYVRMAILSLISGSNL